MEDEGYKVEYSGLQLGFFDSGIDLIAIKESEALFVQCKYKKGRISKSAIEWILYKASAKLLRSSSFLRNKITFVLVVNNKDSAFGRKVTEKSKRNLFSRTSLSYPLLEYFLNHNNTQSRVSVAFREISMTGKEIT